MMAQEVKLPAGLQDQQKEDAQPFGFKVLP